MDIEIRKAEFSDLETLTHIYNQAILSMRCTCDMEPFTCEQRVEWFNSHQNDRFPLFTVLADGKIVGWSSISPYRTNRKALQGVTEISYYLDFDYCGVGIGSKLLEYTMARAKEIGFKTIIAVILGSNLASKKLLEKYGFTQWGCMPSICEYEDRTDDHVYYGKYTSEI